MKARKYKGWFRFWITSNRGTDQSTFKYFAEPVIHAEIKDALEEWCSGFAAWTISDIKYGFEKKQPPIAELRAKLKKAQDARKTINKEIKQLETEIAKRKS